jgi:hypothetical protein
VDTGTIGTSTRSRALGAAAAIAAGAGFLGIAAFQVALAAGAPLGQAAWGGAHDGQLPTSLRVASAVAVGVWVLAALIVLGRAGFEAKPLPPTVLRLGPWILVCVCLIGALMNFLSPSAWERFLWAPFTLALAWLCLFVARTRGAPAASPPHDRP